jgi:hypothetical protein
VEDRQTLLAIGREIHLLATVGYLKIDINRLIIQDNNHHAHREALKSQEDHLPSVIKAVEDRGTSIDPTPTNAKVKEKGNLDAQDLLFPVLTASRCQAIRWLTEAFIPTIIKALTQISKCKQLSL